MPSVPWRQRHASVIYRATCIPTIHSELAAGRVPIRAQLCEQYGAGRGALFDIGFPVAASCDGDEQQDLSCACR